MSGVLKRLLCLMALLCTITVTAGAAKLPDGVFQPHDPTYGAQLTSQLSRAAYRALDAQLAPGVSEVTVDLRPFSLTTPDDIPNALSAAVAAYVYDHPESQYCLIGNMHYDLRTAVYHITQDPNAKAMKSALDDTLRTFASDFDRTLPRAEQYRLIHDNICAAASYNTAAAASGSSSTAHTAYGLLVLDAPVVCEGYAKSFKLLCDAVGLPCILAAGETGTDKNKDGIYEFTAVPNHMWVLVEIDGGWYAIDPTWNDTSTLSHTYFLNNAYFLEGTAQSHRATGNIYFLNDFPITFALPPLAPGSYYPQAPAPSDAPTPVQLSPEVLRSFTARLAQSLTTSDLLLPVSWPCTVNGLLVRELAVNVSLPDPFETIRQTVAPFLP